MANPLPALSLLETRVLGTLSEKQHTVPDSYPMTLNALVSGCNQKTSREPLMELEPGEIGHALRGMEGKGFVRSVHGSRAQRYEHRFDKAFGVTAQQQALLAVLRGTDVDQPRNLAKSVTVE